MSISYEKLLSVTEKNENRDAKYIFFKNFQFLTSLWRRGMYNSCLVALNICSLQSFLDRYRKFLSSIKTKEIWMREEGPGIKYGGIHCFSQSAQCRSLSSGGFAWQVSRVARQPKCALGLCKGMYLVFACQRRRPWDEATSAKVNLSVFKRTVLFRLCLMLRKTSQF